MKNNVLKGKISDITLSGITGKLSLSYIEIKYKEDNEIKNFGSDFQELKDSGLTTDFFNLLNISYIPTKENSSIIYGLIDKEIEIEKKYLYNTNTKSDYIEYEIKILDKEYNPEENTFTLFEI